MNFKIVTYPNDILRKKSKEVEKVDQAIKKIAQNMSKVMFENSGVGLAAPQVGIDKKIIVYRLYLSEELEIFETLINPIIIEKEGEYLSEKEGCLSLPNLREDVVRSKKIKVKALNLEGIEKTIEFEDMAATIIQHEIDHLEGVLLIDKVSSLKKKLYSAKI